MVGILVKVGQNLNMEARVQGRAGHDFLKEGSIHPAGAGKGQELPAGAQKFQPQKVDVLVAAGGLARLGRSGSKFGRVEHNQVEGTPLVAQFAERLEDILPPDGEARLRQRVEAHVRLQALQGGGRGIHRQDGGRPARQGREAEAAGVGEAIQHIFARRQGTQQGAVGALVEVEAGLVARGHVHTETQAALRDEHIFQERLAKQEAAALRQPFQAAHIHIGTLVKTGRAAQFHQEGGQGIAPTLRPGAERLNDEGIGVAVHHQTGERIRFAVYQPQSVAFHSGNESSPQSKGALQSGAEKLRGDGFPGVPGPHAGANLGMGAVGSQGERPPAGVANPQGRAHLRIPIHALHRAGEDPGMAAEKRFFAARFEMKSGKAHRE